ncbi:MAG: cache domain-containing protein, partial [Rhodospirillales bacterium]|nr:cache domain-containing protein [Rhodospirillales bacterium]
MAVPSLRSVLLLPANLYARISIGGRLSIAAIVFAALALCASLAVTVRDAEAELHRQGMARLDANMRVAWEMLRMRGTEYRVEGDRMYAGDKLLNGDYDTVDKIKASVGGVATVFMGDLRITTNIQTPTGRAVGTKLAPGKAYDAVFKENRAYRGPNI